MKHVILEQHQETARGTQLAIEVDENSEVIVIDASRNAYEDVMFTYVIKREVKDGSGNGHVDTT